MIEAFASGNPATSNTLTVVNYTGSNAAIRMGSLVNAQVMDFISQGMVALRIIPPPGQSAEAVYVRVKTNVPLEKGQTVVLEVLEEGKNARFRIVDGAREDASSPKGKFPSRLMQLLEELSGIKRLGNADFKLLLRLFKSLPSTPEFRAVEKMLPLVEELNAGLLKSSVESSGIMLEARLRLAVLNKGLPDLAGVRAGDMKALMLRLGGQLQNSDFQGLLRQMGFNQAEVADVVSRFINNMEFFQLASKINDMLYTYLPVSWEEMKEGELLFKKKMQRGKASYTCDVNLDLEPMGRVSASVTFFEGVYYVSFQAERKETRELIESGKAALLERFAAQGLDLRTVNIGGRNRIDFGETQNNGINITV